MGRNPNCDCRCTRARGFTVPSTSPWNVVKYDGDLNVQFRRNFDDPPDTVSASTQVPRTVAIDSTGAVYAASQLKIRKWGSGGERLWSLSYSQIDSVDIDIDDSDNIFLLKSSNSALVAQQIIKMDTDGIELASIGGIANAGARLAAAPDGSLVYTVNIGETDISERDGGDLTELFTGFPYGVTVEDVNDVTVDSSGSVYVVALRTSPTVKHTVFKFTNRLLDWASVLPETHLAFGGVPNSWFIDAGDDGKLYLGRYSRVTGSAHATLAKCLSASDGSILWTQTVSTVSSATATAPAAYPGGGCVIQSPHGSGAGSPYTIERLDDSGSTLATGKYFSASAAAASVPNCVVAGSDGTIAACGNNAT